MHQTKQKLLLLPFLVMLASCIKSYEPVIATSDINKFVVSGVVTNHDGNQTVTISMTSSINKAEERPVPGCIVTISDAQGNIFTMADSSDGNYHGWIDPMYLIPGKSFKVDVVTPDGSKIESDFDQISICPKVDSVYYMVKDQPTTDPATFLKGIQFYVDLDGDAADSRYYRWEVFETWEYHTDYPIVWYWIGTLVHVSPPDYSKQVCWTTLMARNIFTLSTEGLAGNKYRQFPLNFADNQSSRLVWGYSLLVNQYALSEAAYKYWNQLRINSTNAGGLYERQPMATKGNLHNLTHPDQDVLGFFGASSVTSKRIFVKDVPGLALEYTSPCTFNGLSPYGLGDLSPIAYPVYLVGDQNGWQPEIMSKECVDCRTFLGGKTVKPDYWPW